MEKKTIEAKANKETLTELESAELEAVSGGGGDLPGQGDSEDPSRRVIVGGGFGGDTIESP